MVEYAYWIALLPFTAAILIFFFGNKITSRLARTSGETVKEIKKIKKEFMEAVNDDDEKTKKT